jgi:hypothetical protein
MNTIFIVFKVLTDDLDLRRDVVIGVVLLPERQVRNPVQKSMPIFAKLCSKEANGESSYRVRRRLYSTLHSLHLNRA